MIFNQRKNKYGQAISEAGPALLILFLLFFPLIDLLMLFVSYCGAYYLNYEQCLYAAEQAVVQMDQQGTNPTLTNMQVIQSNVNQDVTLPWQNGGIGKFVSGNLSVNPPDIILIPNAVPNLAPLLQVITTVNIKPFLTIPLPGMNVPGLNKPLSFTFISSRTAENIQPAAANNAGLGGG